MRRPLPIRSVPLEGSTHESHVACHFNGVLTRTSYLGRHLLVRVRPHHLALVFVLVLVVNEIPQHDITRFRGSIGRRDDFAVPLPIRLVYLNLPAVVFRLPHAGNIAPKNLCLRSAPGERHKQGNETDPAY